MSRASRFRGNIPKVNRSKKKEKILIATLGSLAFSLFVVFVVLFSFPTANAKTTVVKEPTMPSPSSAGTITLYTTNQFIRKGSRVNEFQFREVFWPRNAVPEGAVRDLEEVRGKFSKVDITENQPILRTYFSQQDELTSLPITPGMRAVTIAVDSKSGLEGWALPGTRVDVTLTYIVDEELTTKILVQNSRVLSYGGSAQKGGDRDKKQVNRYSRNVGTTITLEVSPSDALKIQTSRQLGTLSLLMRAAEDNEASSVTEVDRNTIDGNERKTTDGKKVKKDCDRGIMKIDGEEYMIDCDGSIGQIGEQ